MLWSPRCAPIRSWLRPIDRVLLMADYGMLTFDKFHDECGVVAIFAHPEAEKLAYLGLHALQHRGQESAGIVTSDGMTSRVHKAMGTVADIFTEDVLSKIPGTIVIVHTSNSTE